MCARRVKARGAALLDTEETPPVGAAAAVIAGALESGGWVFVCGNGGSAALANHMVAELVGRFRLERPAYRALSLAANAAVLTAVANDYGFEEVFARQLRGVIRSRDVLVTISTSGLSPNVIAAARAARERGAWVVAMVGAVHHGPNTLARFAHTVLRSPGADTAAIQEHQQRVVHQLCHLIETRIDGQTSHPSAVEAGQSHSEGGAEEGAIETGPPQDRDEQAARREEVAGEEADAEEGTGAAACRAQEQGEAEEAARATPG